MERGKVDNASSKQQSPRHLFKELQQRQAQLGKAAFKRFNTEAAKFRLFELYPFTPERARTQEAREWLRNDAHKYQFLMMLLRKCERKDNRMFVFANLLYQEGICQPDEFLGKRFSKYARAALRGPRGRLSLTSVRQAFIVATWIPYFEKLLRDKQAGRKLQELGYDETAIEAAEHKTAPLAAACAWLAPSFSVTPAALANAHSKIYHETESLPSSRPGQQKSRSVS